MRKLIRIIMVVIFGGCMSPSSNLPEIHQRVADQVKILIDKGHLSAPYIEIYESFSNDSNVFYYISNSDSPGSENAELPSRVLEYKGRYFCFIELDEPEMTRTELFEKGIVSDSNFQENEYLGDSSIYWMLALRQHENVQTLIKQKPQYYHPTEYPAFWPYFSGDSPQGKSALMTLFQHDVIIPNSLTFLLREREVKVSRQDIERFSGKINIRNLTDSTLILSESPTMGNMSYAVVNGTDTLTLILRDSLPVRISPHDFRCLYYDSESPHDFLRRFSDKEAWMNMYQLFADSTFCFLNINGKPTGFRIQHDDRYSGIILKSDSLSRTINNESFYDKEDRIRRFFKWDQ